MTMRVLILGILAAALAVAPAAQAKAPRCDSKARTVSATESVRVFATGKGSLEAKDLWACRRPKGKAMFLFDGARNEKWSSPRIAGDRFVSVIGRYVSPVDGLTEIDVSRVDLLQRQRSDWKTPLTHQPFGADVALAEDGTEALIDRNTGSLILGRAGQGYSSPGVVIESGAALSELATSGSRIYWLNDGTARTLDPGSTTPFSGRTQLSDAGSLSSLAVGGSPKCDRAKGSTVRESPTARVYMRTDKRYEQAFACRRGDPKRTRQLIPYREGIYGAELAGRYALLITAQNRSDSAGSTGDVDHVRLSVTNLLTRRTEQLVTVPGVSRVPIAVLAQSGRFGYFNGDGITIAGGLAPTVNYPWSGFLASSWGGIWWIGSDGLPYFSG